jgi:hypothetical protein
MLATDAVNVRVASADRHVENIVIHTHRAQSHQASYPKMSAPAFVVFATLSIVALKELNTVVTEPYMVRL